VACNLAPIGDFLAVLLLGAGATDFTSHPRLALPTAVVGLVVFPGLVVLVVHPARDVLLDALRRRITVAAVNELYARIRLRRRHLVPAVLVLVAMLCGWTLLPSLTVPPHLDLQRQVPRRMARHGVVQSTTRSHRHDRTVPPAAQRRPAAQQPRIPDAPRVQEAATTNTADRRSRVMN